MDSFSSIWYGRCEPDEPPGGGRWHQKIQPWTQGVASGVASDVTPGIVVLGFAVDEGVRRNEGRVGAADGPRAIRSILRNLPCQDEGPLWDAGDIACPAGDLESAQGELAEQLSQVLTVGGKPIVLGGGHEVAWGSFQGLEPSWKSDESLLVVNFDAHFDLRATEPGNSGTCFFQMHDRCRAVGKRFQYAAFGISRFANTRGLFARATQLQVPYVLDEQLQAETHLAGAKLRLSQLLAAHDRVYLTICLDVLPAAVAPGVSAPAGLGVPLAILEPLIELIADSGKLVLADIAELNPLFDRDHQTARVAARLVARLARSWQTRPADR
ncbi:MAG: formimidoylglutamase [Pirellulaceae bacterium]|nr:formimidoylglutamase [Pirellulaceae bacterium]